MTEPRRKEWLFDEEKLKKLVGEGRFSQLHEFIQSAIQRNVKDFAKQVRQEIAPGIPDAKDHYSEQFNYDLDAALKERGVE